MIPSQLTLVDIQTAFRRVQNKLDSLDNRNIDMNGYRITNAGDSVGPRDYVTQFELKEAVEDVKESTVETTTGLLNAATLIRAGAYATRGSAPAHINEIFMASDRDYVGFFSNGSAWVYAFGTERNTFANRPTPTSDETNYAYYATDTFQMFYWTGSAWVEDIASDTAYGAGWNGSLKVPTQNAVYDKIETIVSDDAYGAGWNGVTTIAPSKNAVYDKIETLGGSFISDDAYGAGWNGSTTVAPSQNAVYDKIETLLGSSAYTVTNLTTDRSYDADAPSLLELADVLGTLISDLQGKGILS